MSTTTQRETPSRTDTFSLNLDALEHVGTAAENRKLVSQTERRMQSRDSAF